MKRQSRDAILRRHFPSFIQRCFTSLSPATPYQHNWHLDLIAEYLEACRAGEIHRLIINIPPRSLKSICVSVAWPAWLLGQDPSTKILAASYAQSLANTHATACRSLLDQRWYQSAFPHTQIEEGADQKARFSTTQHGFRLATSIGGSITGEGGDFLIVDDPHDPRRAFSDTLRTHAHTWFDQTFYTRLNNKKRGCIVIVMQRLHTDDLTGYLLQRSSDEWEHLCIPAIAEQKAHYQIRGVSHLHEAGELLHPDREGEKELAKAKTVLGSYGFSAQYQQQPLRTEGQLIEAGWFQSATQIPDGMDQIIQSWDTAFKTGKNNDYSVCVTIGLRGDAIYVLDVFRTKLAYPHLKQMIREKANQHAAHTVLIEDTAAGQSLIQDVREDLQSALIPCRPDGDKTTRLLRVISLLERGLVHLPEKAIWRTAFLNELMAFPDVAHDDQVDALTQALEWIKRKLHHQPTVRRF